MMEKLRALIYFIPFIKKYYKQEIVLVILMLLSSAGTLVAPFVLKLVIDEVIPSHNYNFLLVLLATYFLICIIRIIIQYCSTYLFDYVSNNIMKDIRLHLFSHLLRLPMDFYVNNKVGDIMHRINSEVNSIQNILTNSFIRLISNLSTIVGLIIALSLLNVKLFFISAAILPLIFLNTKYFQPKIHEKIKVCRTTDANILNIILEKLLNVRLIKSFMTYEKEEKDVSSHIDEQITINLEFTKLSNITRNITLLLTISVPILILCIGGKDVILGYMTLGSLVAFIQYSNKLYAPLKDLMSLYFDMIRAVVSMDRIYEIMLIPQEQTNHLPRHVRLEGNIIFHDVSFSYRTTPILQHFTLNLKSGVSYAIVGKSGCGKSTLVNLLCRFYHPQSGYISISNIPIDTLPLKQYRERINLISQENYIFNDTIKNNITYYNPTCSSKQLEKIIEICDLGTLIKSLPHGIETMVGDQGCILSGGQKQKIALARALYKEADIIIFDEATSALDTETEHIIQDNILKYFKDKTIIIVSHRLCTLKNVDQIICIKNGMILEQGSHYELYNKRGLYYQLFKEQVI